MNRELEYILCAAIWFDDGKEYVHMPYNISSGYVICGRRHHNCFAIIGQILDEKKHYKNIDEIQGFITSKNRFVTREQAGEIAFAAKQTETLIEKLYSEDLW